MVCADVSALFIPRHFCKLIHRLAVLRLVDGLNEFVHNVIGLLLVTASSHTVAVSGL